MILNVWILLTIVAIVVLGYSLLAASDEIGLIMSALSSVLWLVAAYGALNIETFSRTQDQYIIQSEPALAALACIGVLLSIVNVCTIVFDWFDGSPENDDG